MKLVDLVPAERIYLGVTLSSREQLLDFLAQRVAELGLVEAPKCERALEDREQLGSTGLGSGVAIPHARIAGITDPIGMLVTLAKPIDFESSDQEPVDVAFMLLMPEHSGAEQIKVLSRVAKVARDEPVVNALRQATDAAQAAEILDGADEL